MTKIVNRFEIHLSALGPDSGLRRRRDPSQPMPSDGATAALWEMVEEVRRVAARRGFEVFHAGYGVSASAARAEEER